MPRPLILLIAFGLFTATLVASPALGVPGDVSLETPNAACPKSQVGDEQLQAKYNEIWDLYEKTIQRESKAVEDEIGRLYDRAKSAGNLDLVLFWEGLKKSFAEAGKVGWQPTTQKKDWAKRFQGTEFPDDFTAVLKECESGYGKAKVELESGYKALIAELTRKGKLAEAQAIKSEMGNIWARSSESAPRPEPTPRPRPEPQTAAPKQAPQKPLLERMAGKWSRFGEGYFYHLHADGTAETVDQGTNRVTNRVRMAAVSAEAVEAIWPSGFRDRFVLAGDDLIAVINWNPRGKRDGAGFVLERMK